MKRLKSILGVMALAGAVCAAAALRPALLKNSAYQPAFALTDEVREEVNTSAFATILGEARASMADLMWIKTERYLHRGVAYKPHLDADAMAHTGEVVRQTGHDEHDEHDTHEGPGGHPHHGEALQALVPDRAHDYRGFIGTLQREIQPWKGPDQPDEHTAGDELVPWYRLLTYSDPHHWRGYMIGTWWLSRMEKDPGAVAEAARFIEEGIRNNPGVFQLELMAGRLQIQQEHWREALASFEKTIQMALKIRPASGKETPAWSDSDEEDFAAALRYVPSIQWRKLGDAAGAWASLARGLALLPGDRPLGEMRKLLDGKH